MSEVYDLVDLLGVNLELPASTNTAWFTKAAVGANHSSGGVRWGVSPTCVRRFSKGSIVSRFKVVGDLIGVMVLYADSGRKELYLMAADKITDEGIELVKTMSSLVEALSTACTYKFSLNKSTGWVQEGE